MAPTTTQGTFIAVYVRLHLDRGRVRLHYPGHPDATSPIHLCGTPTESLQEAEQQARDTVNAQPVTSRGTILPRVFHYEDGETIHDVGDRAQDWFEQLIRRMDETADVIEHNEHCRR